MVTSIYAVLFAVATAVLVGGLAHKIWIYAVTPAPLKIPTTPAPVTRAGVAFSLAREVVLLTTARANACLIARLSASSAGPSSRSRTWRRPSAGSSPRSVPPRRTTKKPCAGSKR